MADPAESNPLSMFTMIEEALGKTAAPEPQPDDSFRFPLRRLLELIPSEYRSETPIDPAGPADVVIQMPDLFQQMRRGRVQASVAALAAFVPSHLLTHAAFEDWLTVVDLPLPEIVRAVGTKAMMARVSKSQRVYGFEDRLRDPFMKPEAGWRPQKEPALPPPQPLPPASAPLAQPPPVTVPPIRPPVTPEPVPAPSPEPAALPVAPPIPAVPAPPAQSPLPPRAPEAHPLNESSLAGNVDLNIADVPLMLTLDGMTADLADQLAAFRAAHGPFRDIFDIINVPGMTAAAFERLTGMPYAENHYHRRRKLAAALHIAPEQTENLAIIAQAFLRNPDFYGCVISDPDGLLLAQSGERTQGEAVSAMVPRILSHIQEIMNVVEVGNLDSVSVSVNARVYTMVITRRVILTIVHDENRITKPKLALIRKVAGELEWILSRRAYVSTL